MHTTAPCRLQSAIASTRNDAKCAMPPILALEKISKRFGAIVVADGIDLALAQGEALGIIGPNGAGKTTLFGIITGTVAPDAGRVLFDGADITRAAAGAALPSGHRALVPDPAAVRRHDGVREPGGRRRLRRPAGASATSMRAASTFSTQCGLADKANRHAGSADLLDRKRLELARALATEPRVLLLDEVAGGLTEHECAALVALIKDVRATGVSIIWIEHVVHALVAVVDRLVVLHGGALHRAGRSADRDPQPRGRRDLHGDRGRCLSAAARGARARRLLRRLPGAVRRLAAGRGRRGGGGDRRQRRRQEHAAQEHRRPDARRGRDAIVFDGEPIGDLPAYAIAARGIALVPGGPAAVSLAHASRRTC